MKSINTCSYNRLSIILLRAHVSGEEGHDLYFWGNWTHILNFFTRTTMALFIIYFLFIFFYWIAGIFSLSHEANHVKSKTNQNFVCTCCRRKQWRRLDGSWYMVMFSDLLNTQSYLLPLLELEFKSFAAHSLS